MNGFEVAGVFFCIIVGVLFVYVLGYLLIGDANDDNDDRALGSAWFTILLLIIALTMATVSFIENKRKNDEYKKVISEYEADKETPDASSN